MHAMKVMYSLLWCLFVLCCCNSQSDNRRTKTQDAEYVHRTIKQLTDVIVQDIFSPPAASRIYVYVSIAGYETALHLDNNFNSLAGQLNGLEKLPKPIPEKIYSYPLATVVAMIQTGRS